jgi:hypothetical protein
MLMCLDGRKWAQLFRRSVVFVIALVLFIAGCAFVESGKALWLANGPDVLEFGPDQLTYADAATGLWLAMPGRLLINHSLLPLSCLLRKTAGEKIKEGSHLFAGC